MGSFLEPARRYSERKALLSQADQERLTLEEEQIAAGTEEYRAMDLGDVRIHSFDFGFISFEVLSPTRTRLIAFTLYDQP